MDFDFILNFEFLIPGLVTLFGSIVMSLCISRDMKKTKILLFPMQMAFASLGFKANIIFLIGTALLFIIETNTFGVITDYIAQMRGR